MKSGVECVVCGFMITESVDGRKEVPCSRCGSLVAVLATAKEATGDLADSEALRSGDRQSLSAQSPPGAVLESCGAQGHFAENEADANRQSETAEVSSKTATLPCPNCGRSLRLLKRLGLKRIRCASCHIELRVSTKPWRLTIVGQPCQTSRSPGDYPFGREWGWYPAKPRGKFLWRFVVATGVLAAMVAVAVWLMGRLGSPPDDWFRYLPHHYEIFATYNIRELMASEVYERLRDSRLAPPNLSIVEQFLRQSRLAPSEVKRVRLATVPESLRPVVVYELAEPLEYASFLSRLGARGRMKTERVGGIPIYSWDRIALAFPGESEAGTGICNAIVTGEVDLVRQSLARRFDPPSIRPPDLDEVLASPPTVLVARRIPAGHRFFWARALAGADQKLASVDWIVDTAFWGGQLDFMRETRWTDEAGAKARFDQLAEALTAARQTAKDSPRILAAVSSAETSIEGRWVAIQFRLQPDEMDAATLAVVEGLLR